MAIKLMPICLWGLLLYGLSCAGPSPRDLYLQQHPQLSPEIVIAIRNLDLVNGMTAEEVRLVLGEPTFTEHQQEKQERWVYRGKASGSGQAEVYTPDSAFPQGIGFVIPFHYRAQEIRVDFVAGKVCRVQKILSF